MMQRNRKASVSTVILRGIHVCEKIDAMRVFQPPLLCHGSIWRWPLRSIEEVQWSSMWENETSSPEILKIRPFFSAISVDLTDLNYYGRQIKGFFKTILLDYRFTTLLEKFSFLVTLKINTSRCVWRIYLILFSICFSKEFMIVWKRLLGAFSSFSLVYMAWLSTFFSAWPGPKRLIIFVFKGPISRSIS